MISFICFPIGDANWNLSHDCNRTTERLLLRFNVHLHCTIPETCSFVMSVYCANLLSTPLSVMIAQIFLVGRRMCLAFSRLLILIMHFVRTTCCSHKWVWGSCQENEGVRLQFRKLAKIWLLCKKMVIKHSIIQDLRGAFPDQGDGFIPCAKDLYFNWGMA
jgi:hypothetical protein